MTITAPRGPQDHPIALANPGVAIARGMVDGGSYVELDGVPVWHFVGGDPAGAPTVLLHGAFASAATWGPQIAAFSAAGLRVHVPERSGHGHSPDVAGSWTLTAMARQVIAYLDTVVGAPAHLVGWSDGAVVALLVAHARPDLVARVVLTCHFVNPEGVADSRFLSRLNAGDPDLIDFLRANYVTESPDGPAYFTTVCEKSRDLLTSGPYQPISDFATVEAPTLVVAADRGVVRIEHALELARTLPHGRFAVLPGTHILPVECPELFNPLVLSFLAADPESEWMP